MNLNAALVAEKLRTGKKQQGLSDAQIVDEIERQTGSRPSLMWVSRRLLGNVPILQAPPGTPTDRARPEFIYRADEALVVALGLDPAEILQTALSTEQATDPLPPRKPRKVWSASSAEGAEQVEAAS